MKNRKTGKRSRSRNWSSSSYVKSHPYLTELVLRICEWTNNSRLKVWKQSIREYTLRKSFYLKILPDLSIFPTKTSAYKIEIVFNAMMLDSLVVTELVFKRVIQHCFYPSNFHLWRKTERSICSKFFSITL